MSVGMVLSGPAEDGPPPRTIDKGDVARLLMYRQRREAELKAVNQTGATLTDGGWIAQVGIWPCNEATIGAVQSALAPMDVETFPAQVAHRLSTP